MESAFSGDQNTNLLLLQRPVGGTLAGAANWSSPVAGSGLSADSPADINGTLPYADYGGNSTLLPATLHPAGPPLLMRGEVRIPLYSLIFLLSVVGNTLVIVTLAQNKRMRTVTNVFLLNLSISDMLLAVFCMPFTLIPTLLQNFIFGKTMCIMIRYLQAVSVGVSVFTLVSISLERYFAICHPLRSRSWQTLSHSYKMIAGVWLAAFLVAVPIGVCQRLLRLPDGRHKCREMWENRTLEKTYTVFLDLLLLVLPLLLMLVAYGLISRTLWKGMQLEMRSTQEMKELRNPSGSRDEEEADTDEEGGGRYGNGVLSSSNGQNRSGGGAGSGCGSDRRSSTTARRKFDTTRYQNIRHSNTEKSLAAKRRVIRMLFVVVVEFFVCWTPLWVMQTWYTLEPRSARTLVSPVCMNFIHLLSYVSSCCNPITYCFMNRKFRHAFLAAFHCCGYRKKSTAWREASTFGQSQRTGKLAAACAMSHQLKVLSARCQHRYRSNIEHRQSLQQHFSRSPSPDLSPE